MIQKIDRMERIRKLRQYYDRERDRHFRTKKQIGQKLDLNVHHFANYSHLSGSLLTDIAGCLFFEENGKLNELKDEQLDDAEKSMKAHRLYLKLIEKYPEFYEGEAVRYTDRGNVREATHFPDLSREGVKKSFEIYGGSTSFTHIFYVVESAKRLRKSS